MNIQNKSIVSDAAYRRATKRLGYTLVLFSLLFIGLEILADVVLSPWLHRMNKETELLVVELTRGVAYLISFLLPAWVLGRITPRCERSPLLLESRLPCRVVLMLPAGLAVIYTAALANDFLVRSLGWSSGDVTIPYWVDGMPVYEIVLLFLTSVLIPAFCEELLFRGVVLSVLRPYGRTVSIFGSAVLFALMHQSADQLLYTAVAGVVLAYITLESSSVWGAMLLHLLNNALAALQVVLYETLASGMAKICFAITEVVVIGGGLCCLVVLLTKCLNRQATRASEGCSPLRPVRNFLTWPMMVFIGLSIAQMVLLVVLEVTR